LRIIQTVTRRGFFIGDSPPAGILTSPHDAQEKCESFEKDLKRLHVFDKTASAHGRCAALDDDFTSTEHTRRIHLSISAEGLNSVAAFQTEQAMVSVKPIHIGNFQSESRSRT
jgi:hypothetical protein